MLGTQPPFGPGRSPAGHRVVVRGRQPELVANCPGGQFEVVTQAPLGLRDMPVGQVVTTGKQLPVVPRIIPVGQVFWGGLTQVPVGEIVWPGGHRMLATHEPVGPGWNAGGQLTGPPELVQPRVGDHTSPDGQAFRIAVQKLPCCW